MIRKLKLILLVSGLFLYSNSYSQEAIQLNSTGNHGIEFTTNNFFELSGSFEVSHFRVKEVSTEEGNFSKLMVPGCTQSNQYGSPEMPVYRKLVRVPLGATAKVSILNAKSMEIKLSDEGYNHPVYPSQPPRSKSEDIHDFVINHQAYLADKFSSQERLTVDMLGILRNQRIARINFRPFEYNPAQNTLMVYYDVEFRIEFENADIPATLELQEKFASTCFTSVNNSLVNVSRNDHKDNFKSYPVKYVIISDRMFENQLQDLIAWKTKKGFIVVESYTDEPAVGNTLASIKSYVQGLYNGATPDDPAPSYVLLVGDIQQIPTWDNGNGVTDRNYFEYTGDLFPEIYYGRFSAQNTTQLQPYIDKTLQYEQYTMPDPSYLDEVVMVAGMDGSFGASHGNGQINYGTINYFNTDHDIISHTYLYPNSGPSAAQIRQDISDGVTFGNYTAHCSPNGWSDPSFEISHIPALQNQDMYCVLIGNCCSSSEYQLNECFAEAIVRAENKGAVGYIGGSNSTYWDEDYYFGVGVGTINQNPPPYEQTGLGNYDRSFHDHGEAFTDWYVSGDEIIFAGNLAVSESGSSREQYYWDIYNYMGDPSLMVYYSNPPPTTASYTPLIPLQSTSFTVNTESFGYVALSLDGEYIAAALADTNGLAILEFDPLSIAGVADVVITRQNGQPYFGTVTISSPTGPYLMLDEVTIGDTTGNNNGYADFGEDISLDLSLENVGFGDAENTLSTLIGTDPELVITKVEHNWPTIPGQSTLTENGVFEMSISNDVEDQHTVHFNIELEAPTKEMWIYEYDLVINAPVLTIESMIIDDSQSGNNNGRLDPGETATIKVINKNTGHVETHDAIAQLSSLSQYLTFSNNTYAVGTLGLLGYKYSEFEVTVDADAPNGAAFAEFDYVITSGEYSAVKEFSKKIGLIVEDFETGDFTKFEWEHDGDGYWEITNAYPYEGIYSAISGDIGDSQTSILEIDVEVMLHDSVTFVYKTASQTGKDKLKFYINNSLQGEWSGIGGGWNRVAYPVSPGNYTFKWVYEKDASGFAGNDCAWLDYITFPALMTLTCYAGPDDYTCTGSDYQCQGEATDWIAVEWTTSGDGSFDDTTLLDPVYTPGANDIINGEVELIISAEDDEGLIRLDEMMLTIMDAPDTPEIPTGPLYVNLANVTSSVYTTEAVPYTDHYSWVLEPAEAGSISGMSTAGTVQWDPTYLGTAIIKVKAINSCGEGAYSEDREVTVDNVTGVQEQTDGSSFRVFPNPNSGNFNILAYEDLEDATISIYSLVGEHIYHAQENLNNGRVLSIDLSNQPKGLYILSVSTKGKRFNEKLIVR